MGRTAAKELSPLEVRRITKHGSHRVGGVRGLALRIGDEGRRSWIMHLRIGGKVREMGLGSFPTVTLEMARKLARDALMELAEGINPIEERRKRKAALAAEAGRNITFAQAAERYVADHEAAWKNPKTAARWLATLENYAYPTLGKLLVRDIALPHVLDVLKPIWATKTETATKLRGRIDMIMDWAAVHGYREGPSPARWKGHLDHLLARPSKVARVSHHAAMPYADIGAFMPALRAVDGMGARALEFVILTAARSGEVRGATWDEIDLQARTWTIPAERMKSSRPHRVPLSAQAVTLLERVPRIGDETLVFPSAREGRPISDMTISAVLRRMGLGHFTVHGFRSSFRDWAAEQTNYPREICELALAHAVGEKVERAYQRSDLLEKRTRLMQDWAAHCERPAAGESVVVPIRKLA